jgi:hypothetical protein
MNPELLIEIGNLLKNEEIDSDYVTVGDHLDLVRFQKDERSEWYNKSHRWFYWAGATLLIYRQELFNSISYGYQNAQREPVDAAYIWFDL